MIIWFWMKNALKIDENHKNIEKLENIVKKRLHFECEKFPEF